MFEVLANAPRSEAVEWALRVVPVLVSVTISTVIMIFMNRQSAKSQRRQSIHDRVTKLIDVSLAYPLVESDGMTQNWPDVKFGEEDRLRYENYCCMVFNLLHDCWDFTGGDRRKTRSLVYVDELIYPHVRWWKGDEENQTAYPKGFRDYIQAEINRIRAERKPDQKTN